MTEDLIWLPGLISLVLAVVSGRVMIPWLTRMKFGQAIRSDGPRKHLSKEGTPTMGGLIFLFPVIFLAVLPGSGVSYPVTFSLLGFGFLGYLDDILKIRRRRSEGLTPGQKMAGQLLLSVAITLFIFQGTTGGDLYFFSRRLPLEAGWLRIPLAVLVLTGFSNAFNLTDGLDGLLPRVSLPVFAALGILSLVTGFSGGVHFVLLLLPALLGFLWYNRNPARVFMGDTGSLALGGAAGALALCTGTELSLLILAGIPLAETLSVILQVASFRLRDGKRIFRMAPLHHHFELGGMEETRVVRRFALTSWLCAAAGLAVFLI